MFEAFTNTPLINPIFPLFQMFQKRWRIYRRLQLHLRTNTRKCLYVRIRRCDLRPLRNSRAGQCIVTYIQRENITGVYTQNQTRVFIPCPILTLGAIYRGKKLCEIMAIACSPNKHVFLLAKRNRRGNFLALT